MTTINFSKSAEGLIPAIIQDYQTMQVLMLGYMNESALAETQKTGKVTFYSRSKQRLWMKGETSGNYLLVQDLYADCDQDALLIIVQPVGPTCHKGTTCCWGDHTISSELHQLQRTVEQKIEEGNVDQSYTASLVDKGVHKVAQKVGEEAVEVVIEALRNDEKLLLEESADLLYHLIVLLASQGKSIDDVEAVLRGRTS